MDKQELKQRAGLVDDRAIVLFKKYPLVGAAVLLVGFVIGFLVGYFV
jgi:hypothetical protein